MEHLITQVAKGSPAARHGIEAGDVLLHLNGEEIVDPVDYEALSTRRHVIIHLRKADGRDWQVELLKPVGTPLGLSFGESMQLTPRVCKNKCVFCFVDQMPPNCRKSLYVKDDDWRMSLMMGNFITLTNVDDQEFARILRRKASPLFISIHATDPELRVKMMRNPAAAKLLPRLQAFKEQGLKFHCQIVLCPGLNDGQALEHTLETLCALAPAAQSAALVPVGLTKYRQGLYSLSPYTRAQAEEVLAICEKWQQKCLKTLGTRFVFPADELLCIAGRDVPEEDFYEGFPQIENGVGLMRQFLSGLLRAREALPGVGKARKVLIPCGTSIAPYLQKWLRAYAPANVQIAVCPIINHFFGETVTVTGLLTGRDMLSQLEPGTADEIILSGVTLREAGDLFLDDLSLDAFRAALPVPVTISPNTGEGLYRALLGE